MVHTERCKTITIEMQEKYKYQAQEALGKLLREMMLQKKPAKSPSKEHARNSNQDGIRITH
ncbi:MAG: hypothetical protein MRJ65_09195 [Candidatus Brocadiaceae bacterium]|nr:hypothetical protein [Candidatus Brocadiaceae bacterium]